MTGTIHRGLLGQVCRDGYEPTATHDPEMGYPNYATMNEYVVQAMPQPSRHAALRVAPKDPASISSSGLKHVAKSSVYGLVIGATALTGTFFLTAVTDEKGRKAIDAAPGQALIALEVLGCSVGAAGGAAIGILQWMFR